MPKPPKPPKPDHTPKPATLAARARRTLEAVAETVTTRVPLDGSIPATAGLVALCRLYSRELPKDELQAVLQLAKQVEVEYDQHEARRVEA